MTWPESRRWRSTVIALALLATSCGGKDEPADGRDDEGNVVQPAAAQPASECVDATIFRAMSRTTGVPALCPKTLANDLRLRSVYASRNPPAYVVEFSRADGRPANHLVLELTEQDPPGQVFESRRWRGSRVAFHLVPVRSGEAAGLHSGHFVAAVPTRHGRGAYWVSIHGDSRLSVAANVDRLMLLVRQSTFVGSS